MTKELKNKNLQQNKTESLSQVELRVIPPFYKNKNVALYNADCRTVLDSLPPIDLFITSPPFNLGNNHHTGNKKHFAYNDELPEEEYQAMQIEVLNKCYDKLRQNGSMLYQHKNRIKNGKQITPYEWLLKTKFIIKQEIVWFNGSQNFDKCRFYPMTERVYWLAKNIETQFFNNINHHDLFDWQAVGTDDEHTRRFPGQFVVDMLKCFPDAQLICDPFCGSGTALIVAESMGRKAVGIEKELKYCNLARRQLSQTDTLFYDKAV